MNASDLERRTSADITNYVKWFEGSCTSGYEQDLKKAETALAEAQKLMPCGHPRACRIETKQEMTGPGVDKVEWSQAHCAACEQIDALQGALRDAVQLIPEKDHDFVAYQNAKQLTDIKCQCAHCKRAATALLEGK